MNPYWLFLIIPVAIIVFYIIFNDAPYNPAHGQVNNDNGFDD